MVIFSFKKTGLLIALLCTMGCFSIIKTASAIDVTGMISVQRSGLVLNRTTNTFDSIVTITNIGQQSLKTPLHLVVTITPSSVTLANKAGTMPTGLPYINATVPQGLLNQGQSTTVTLKFNNPSKGAFNVALAVDADINSAGGLPPDPGPAGDATLLGVDSDQDGVRDDIQRYIAFTYPNSEKARRAMLNVAKVYQLKLSVPENNHDKALEVAVAGNNAAYCAYYILGRDAIKARKLLGARILNTSTRLKAYELWNTQLAGEIFRFPENLNGFCPFDSDSLPN